jgi:hypothetical protein
MKAARDAFPLVVRYTGGRPWKYAPEELSQVETLLRERRRSYSPENLREASDAVLWRKGVMDIGRIAPTIEQIASRTGVHVSTIKKIRAARRLTLPQRSYRRRFRATLERLKLPRYPDSYTDPDSIRPPSGRRGF